MKLVTTTRGGKSQKYLLRGDSEGYVTLWTVPDISIDDIKELHMSQVAPKCLSNLNLYFIPITIRITLNIVFKLCYQQYARV